MEQLSNLRWLSLSHNCLTSTEVKVLYTATHTNLSINSSSQGLESCYKLEELILDSNCLSHLPALHHYPHLTWLSLADNKISLLSFPSFPLKHLYHLNLSGNLISTLTGIEVMRC